MCGHVFTMVRMAKKKTDATEAPKTESPKRVNRNGVAITMWMSRTLDAALERYRAKQEVPPHKVDVHRAALKEFLKRRELWTEDDDRMEQAESKGE